MKLKSINPTNDEVIEEYPISSDSEIEVTLTKSIESYQKWKNSAHIDRRDKIFDVANLLKSNRDQLAQLITLEMGKVFKESQSEIDKCTWGCDYYAQHAESMLAPQQVNTDARTSQVSFCPLGVILGIMPWNFPFWQVFRFAVPTLLAGNAVILKHASNVSGCALAMEKIFQQAGLPFSTLLVPGDRVNKIIADRRISAVSLTGSTSAGRSAAELAGRHLKKCVLELGGSDPYVVLNDADLVAAAKLSVQSRLINAGQSCIAAKRFIVPKDIEPLFTDLCKEEMHHKKWGDPLDTDTDIGPLARKDLRDELHEKVQAALKSGAKCELGGVIPSKVGAYYPPTLLSGVRENSVAFNEELFGPVAVVVPAEDEADAIRLANASDYGLGAAIFSRNDARALEIAIGKLEAGNCFVNTFVRSDPRLPFGGIKDSGFGRELSHYGIHEFVNIKSVYSA